MQSRTPKTTQPKAEPTNSEAVHHQKQCRNAVRADALVRVIVQAHRLRVANALCRVLHLDDPVWAGSFCIPPRQSSANFKSTLASSHGVTLSMIVTPCLGEVCQPNSKTGATVTKLGPCSGHQKALQPWLLHRSGATWQYVCRQGM